MEAWVINHAAPLRLAAFSTVFALMAAWELVRAARQLRARKSRRWLANLALPVINASVMWLLLPAGAIGAAILAAERGWGLLHNVELHPALAILVAVVLLDLGIYLQHRLFHAVPILWRLHAVHHADVDFDVTTATRFHPLEIVLSMVIKLALVVLIGAPVLAVLIFEVLLNATAMFNHGNVRLARGLDRWLRWIVVTPDMHRVHHSVVMAETNSNYGFNVPHWDRLFGTYQDQPEAGQDGMTIGLAQYQKASHQPIHWLLGLPFVYTDQAAATAARSQ